MPKVSEAHAEARRLQIIEAACICFARKGFHASTIQEICSTAGLSAGAVYSYFSGKNELIHALVNESVKSNEALFKEVAAKPTVRESFCELTRFFLENLESGCNAGDVSYDSARIKVGLWAESVRDTEFLGELQKSYTLAIDALAAIVSRGQERREISPSLDPVSVAQTFLSLLEGFTLQRAFDGTIDRDRYMAVVETLFDRGLFGGQE
jgi:AcrR family transcriptional regulator